MFLVDEIDELKALLTRSGSTLSSILRSAFTAEGLGFSYRTASSQHLGAGTYRLTLVANVQPARAGALLDDPHGGMLQRFMWFPSTDPRLTFDTPLMPTPLTLPPHSAWQYPRELKVPYIVKHLIKDTHLKSNRGEESPLNSHALFAREKFAFALAVLDGRDEMTEEDWRLAGVASRVSEHTREWVIQEWESATEAESVREGKKNGQKQFAANQERSHQERVLRNSRRQQIIEKIAACGHAGLTRDELLHKFHSRYRDMLGPLFDGMVEDGILVRNSQDERRYVMADEDES
ncbi:hypothetical protein AO501_29815 [Mycobacterium gordonae]|uniref:Uncharacterized protein n=2 Tax=Mycobacteriaceae TaxID=1762 RepID=A0A0Q2LG31_MYCGO|nr:hypothetical protein AO501_29815 [Mycobacterium gordonae]